MDLAQKPLAVLILGAALFLFSTVVAAGEPEVKYAFSFDDSGEHFRLAIHGSDGTLVCSGQLADQSASISATLGSSPEQLSLSSTQDQAGLRIRIESEAGCWLDYFVRNDGSVDRTRATARSACDAEFIIHSDLYRRIRKGYLQLNMGDRSWISGDRAPLRQRVVDTLAQFLFLESRGDT